MASGDHYICKDCKYEWRTRKDVGSPSICPKCRKEMIQLKSEYDFQVKEAEIKKREYDKRMAPILRERERQRQIQLKKEAAEKKRLKTARY